MSPYIVRVQLCTVKCQKVPLDSLFVREMSVKITSPKQMAPKSHETGFSFVKESVSSYGSLGGYRKIRPSVMSVSKNGVQNPEKQMSIER
jgi:hypothetical protein